MSACMLRKKGFPDLLGRVIAIRLRINASGRRTQAEEGPQVMISDSDDKTAHSGVSWGEWVGGWKPQNTRVVDIGHVRTAEGGDTGREGRDEGRNLKTQLGSGGNRDARGNLHLDSWPGVEDCSLCQAKIDVAVEQGGAAGARDRGIVFCCCGGACGHWDGVSLRGRGVVGEASNRVQQRSRCVCVWATASRRGGVFVALILGDEIGNLIRGTQAGEDLILSGLDGCIF
ncbi:hypothetical protein DFH09DRAFT_1394068 [Mycena vulgaris]|nr:hypothetical protein DFH09DRAFT_1394068 [Mycena vulgaris]